MVSIEREIKLFKEEEKKNRGMNWQNKENKGVDIEKGNTKLTRVFIEERREKVNSLLAR